MRPLRAFWLRLLGTIGIDRRQREFADELSSHLQLHIDDNLRAGMTPDEARRNALVTLGGVAQTHERMRDRSRLPFLDALGQDLRGAARMLRKNPGFTAAATLTMALGIGANSAIFAVVNAVLLRPLPFREPNRVVMVFASSPKPGNPYDETNYPAYLDFQAQNRSFESMAAIANWRAVLKAPAETVLVTGKAVTRNMFDVLGVRPSIGRTFREREESNVVVLNDRLWRRWYGGRDTAIGESVRINDTPYTIVGIMPAGFSIEHEDEPFYTPVAADSSRGHDFLRVIARLRPGVTVARAQADMTVIANRLALAYPVRHAGVGAAVVPIADALARHVRFGLLTLLGVVFLVLLIACTNVAGLMLAQAATRQREFAVRAALGAGRTRLVRQLLTESTAIAVIGGALGLVAGHWTSRILAVVLSEYFNVPRAAGTSTDVAVLVFTLIVSIATGVLFGTLPAFTTASPRLNDVLRDATRSASGVRAPRLRRALVIVETALALVLLAGAASLLKTFIALRTTHPGFDAANVLEADLFLPQPRFVESAERPVAVLPERTRFYAAALERVRALPWVDSAAFVANPPPSGTDSESFHIVGVPDPPSGLPFKATFNIVSPGYFRLMRIPFRAGRDFSDQDGSSAPGVAIVNETAARRFWTDKTPIGQQLVLPLTPQRSAALTIVGVVGDVRQAGLGVPPRPEIFVHAMQSLLPWMWTTLAVRTNGDPDRFVDPLARTLRDVDADVPIRRVDTAAAVVSRSIGEPRLYTALLGAFSALALLLAAIGLYGLIAYSVSTRAQELGVRVALGATRGHIVGLVLRQGLWLALTGTAIGIAVGLAATRTLVGLIAGVQPNDPVTFLVVSSVLLLVACVASYVPARRAARVDPVVALRSE